MSEIAVLILMGSDSDAPVMQGAVDVLRDFGIPCEMTVASAHRSPERVMRLVGEAPGRGVKSARARPRTSRVSSRRTRRGR